jgi:hypothetical protein
MKRQIQLSHGAFGSYLQLNESDPNTAAREHQRDYYEIPLPEQLEREQALVSMSTRDHDADEPHLVFNLWPNWR